MTRPIHLTPCLIALLVVLTTGDASSAGVIIYASDFSGGRLIKIDGAQKTTIISGVSQPMASSFGLDGNLYLAQQSGQRISRYTPAGKSLGNSFGTGRFYTGLAFGPDGRLYTSAAENNFQTGLIERFNASSGAALGTGLAPGDLAGYTKKTNTTYFEGLNVGPDGNLYASSHYGNCILVFAGPSGPAPGSLLRTLPGIEKPTGLAFSPDGTLYAAEQDRNRIVRWDGDSFSVYASGAKLATPIGLGFASDGDLYVANYNAGNIVHFQGPSAANPGAFVSTFATGIGNPGYILVLPEPPSAIVILGVTMLLLCTRRRNIRPPAAAATACSAFGLRGLTGSGTAADALSAAWLACTAKATSIRK